MGLVEAVTGAIVLIFIGLISFLLQRIFMKLEEIIERLSGCVTWADLDKELGPIRLRQGEHRDRITVLETRCEEHRK